MAGEIKHEWNGTVLTITSDSGTSSADLIGPPGKQGIRGPQGRPGEGTGSGGSVDVDLENYYTITETQEYVAEKIAEAQLEGAEVDLSLYATKSYVDEAIAEAEISGGGGGGTVTGSVFSYKSTTGWLFKTISESAFCFITGNWSSTVDGISTGRGMLSIAVDGVTKKTKNIDQGNFSEDVAPYLTTGENSVKVTVSDAYGNSNFIIYTINVIALKLTSTFDANIAYEGAINYSYTPTGELDKTVYFILDGKVLDTKVVSTSGRQQPFTIPAQKHGAHTFEVYFTAVIDGDTVESNRLYYELICTQAGITTPIIASTFSRTTMEQYETVLIPYIVYNPASLNSNVTLVANGYEVNTLTVDRKPQTWAYRADTYGNLRLVINCGGVTKSFSLNVTASSMKIEAVTENLELYLSSYGRSNNEAKRDKWEYKNVACKFDNYNWVSDGWQRDEDGITVHRVTGNAQLTIPLQLFKNDFRTTGKTIEFEFATRDVLDYDAVIASCYSGNVGFKLTAQEAMLKSEQSELKTQYKENEHVRLTFVVEKKVENKLLYIYLNGIMCGAAQYPEDDDFSQSVPVNIIIGSNKCTIDLYTIRVYDNNLTRYQVLENWIADTQNLTLKVDRYVRNNIFNTYGSIIIDNLPKNLPYMILRANQLPQFKDNVLPVDGEYVNPSDTTKSFTFEEAEADVQGTSSAGYARKNYKIKFPEQYKLRDDSIPTNVFTFKADVASSEGANNVELVRLYNSICPYKTPPQEANSAVRQGIDGLPMIIFHNDGSKTEFIGKYNFNNDKATPEVFGLAEGDESWEIRNNTSNRVIWKNADFSGDDWKNDFEARYPKNNEDVTRLSAFAEWIVSTDQSAATNADLGFSVIYEGVTYTTDTAAYRLAKFKAEITDWVELDSSIFYYLFTELFLMVDSRAKNGFPSWIGGDKLCWLPYDMDTAIGINNEGALAFGYGLEDTDVTETGADVYNGQQSVMWINLRQAYFDKIKEMYQKLRSDGVLSYEIVENMFEEHQSVWPEAIWNEDAYYKYLQPLIEDGASIYLPMLQGSKSEQRKWWLYNRFRYMDSKYNAGDAKKDFITLRGYSKSDITVVPYADIYAMIQYGSYLVHERALRGNSYTLECPLDTLNDTEIYIYSASQLKDIGDVSGLNVGLADFSMATKLQHIKVGDSASTYSNTNLNSLTLGNNKLLQTLDARNCVTLGTGEQKNIDVSGCTNIEKIYLTGTQIQGVTLPDGGSLTTLHLPDTLTNLTVMNQPALVDFVLNNPSNITTLRLEGMDDVIPAQRIVEAMAGGGRMRIIGTTMTLVSAEIATAFFDKLATMRGLDENGNNVDRAQISGHVKLSSDCEPYINEWQERYPDVTFEIWTPVLEDTSWAQIAALADVGAISTFFNVGDEKTITLTTGEVVTAVILGFNHDYVNSSSANTIMAPVTFGLKDCLETTQSTYLNYKGYGDSTLKEVIEGYFDLLPTDLQSVITAVQKTYRYYHEDSWTGIWSSYTTSPLLKLWAFSALEVMGTTKEYTSQTTRLSDSVGKQYDYFKQAPIPEGMTPMTEGETTGTYYDSTATTKYYYNQHAIKQLGNESVQNVAYRLRSITQRTVGNSLVPDSYGCYISSIGGRTYTSSSSTSTGITFGFCI